MAPVGDQRWKPKAQKHYSIQEETTCGIYQHHESEFVTIRQRFEKPKIRFRSKSSASPVRTENDELDSPTTTSQLNRKHHRHASLGSRRSEGKTGIMMENSGTTGNESARIHIPALRLVPKHHSTRSQSYIVSGGSSKWQSQDAIIAELNAKVNDLTESFNETKSRNWDMVSEIKRLEASNNDYFLINQQLKRKLQLLKKKYGIQKVAQAEELQARDEKLQKFAAAVTRRDANIERRRAQTRKLRQSEKTLKHEKRGMQVIGDSRAKLIKVLEFKLHRKVERIRDLEKTVNINKNSGTPSRLVEKANRLASEVMKKNEELAAKLEAVTQKYETVQGYSNASRPLVMIGATVRMRYFYERLIELGVVEKMPSKMMDLRPKLNRYARWAWMKADLALFTSGIWTVADQGAYFKAIYPSHTVESCILLEARSNKHMFTFMSLGLMYQDLQKEGRNFAWRGTPYSIEFELLWKKLHQYLSRRCQIVISGTEHTEGEEADIGASLERMKELMGEFRKLEDTKIAVTWLARAGKRVEDVIKSVHNTSFQNTLNSAKLKISNPIPQSASLGGPPRLIIPPRGRELATASEPKPVLTIEDFIKGDPKAGRLAHKQVIQGFVAGLLEKERQELTVLDVHLTAEFMAMNDDRLRAEWDAWEQKRPVDNEVSDEMENEGLFQVPINASKRGGRVSVCGVDWEHPLPKDLEEFVVG